MLTHNRLIQNQDAGVKSNGKTVDEAINRGLDQLGLSRDQVEVEIIKQGSRGILGLGAEDAVVLLVPKPVPAPSAVVTPVAVETPPVKPQPPTEPAPTAIPVATAPHNNDEEFTSSTNAVVFDEVTVARAIAILQAILTRMEVKATVTSRMGTDLVDAGDVVPMILDVTGPDLGLLIGRRGETLQAIQFITRQILSKELGHWAPVVVDVESYLVRRRKTLQQLAVRMADRVVFSHKRVMLEPMPAHERRIIHLQLRDHQQVYTSSTGEGEDRKVVILPK